MKNLIRKSMWLVPLCFCLTISSSAFAQADAQQERIKEIERKIEENRNNPDFDYEGAVKRLEEMKGGHVQTESTSKEVHSNSSLANTQEERDHSRTSERTQDYTNQGDVVVIKQAEFDMASQEKQEVIKSNPDKYIIKDSKPGSERDVIVISKEELESLPVEKQDYIRQNEDLYEIR